MTVTDLISLLRQQDPDLDVVLMDYRGDPVGVFAVEGRSVSGPVAHDRRSHAVFADDGVAVVLIA